MVAAALWRDWRTMLIVSDTISSCYCNQCSARTVTLCGNKDSRRSYPQHPCCIMPTKGPSQNLIRLYFCKCRAKVRSQVQNSIW